MNLEFDNKAKELKLEVLTRIARFTYDGTLEKHIDGMPYDLIKGPGPTYRCCIYKEREIIRERITSARGKLQPGQAENSVIGILPAACEGCPIQRYRVTDNCQQCLSHKCKEACPFDAISITPKGAYIDYIKCKECGRCAASCPYNAISDTLRPCVKVCPVDAISKDDFGCSVIDYSKCISCGACMNSCPFGAIADLSQIVDIIELIESKAPVTAIVAPSIEGHFGDANIGMIKNALKKLGFVNVVEVSLGADAVSIHEAHELKEVIKKGEQVTNSCCTAFAEMTQKHFPSLAGSIAKTVSPMTATARYIRYKNPDAKVVFVGPCVAKKVEITKTEDSADYVMTFEELAAMLAARDISINETSENEQDGSHFGKGFAQSGGICEAIEHILKEEDFDEPFTFVKCNGAVECKKVLSLMSRGKLNGDFIEGMACEGGCVAGPAGITPPDKVKRNRIKLLATADNRSVKESAEEIHGFSKINMNQF